MSVLDPAKVDRLKQILKFHPRGMTISDLSYKLKMNRNLMAKYLDLLLISGQVKMDMIGTAKVYRLSHRVPVSAILEFSSDLAIMLDQEGQILQVNEPVLSLLAETRESLVGKRIKELTTPFLRDLPLTNVEMGEQSTVMSCILNEEKRYFRVKQIPTVFEDGGQGITLIIEDITAQMKYQLMLEMREATYRRIVEDQAELICRFLPDFTITFANLAFTRYFGITYELLKEKKLLSFIVEEDVKAFRQCIASLTPEHSIAPCEIHFPVGTDSHWQSWTFHALFDPKGKLVEIQGTGRDIHREKEEIEERTRELSLQKNQECEKRYRSLVQLLNMGMYRSTGDPNGRFVWGNRALVNLLGFNSMLELQGINVIEIFMEPDMRKELLDDLRKNGFVKSKVLYLKRKDEKPITVTVTAVAEFDQQGNVVFINGLLQDVTEQVAVSEKGDEGYA
jgi:PAS domain S-box-containing protein